MAMQVCLEGGGGGGFERDISVGNLRAIDNGCHHGVSLEFSQGGVGAKARHEDPESTVADGIHKQSAQ